MQLDDFKPLDDIEPDNMMCFDIYSTHHAFGQAYKSLLEPLGLTYPQYLVLISLLHSDDLTVSEIGEKLALESSTLTPMIKRMETNGLLTRKRDIDDERKVRISLTKTGKGLREQALKIPLCIASATGLSRKDIDRLQEMLIRTRRSLLEFAKEVK